MEIVVLLFASFTFFVLQITTEIETKKRQSIKEKDGKQSRRQ